MQTKPNQHIVESNQSIGKKADRKILSLFPSLRFWNFTNQNQKKTALQNLAIINKIGLKGSMSAFALSQELKISRIKTKKEIEKLVSQRLLKTRRKQKTVNYSLTTLGFIALMSFKEYQDWAKIKSNLSTRKKNDPLAYALLVIGYCENKTNGICQTLSSFASKNHTMEQTKPNVTAESLLKFYKQETLTSTTTVPNYLNVFREFTTTGFQDVFRTLIMGIKPTAEDYNGLIEFFKEVTEFYYDPARVAYLNLLVENQKMKQRLDEFKRTQDQQIKKEGQTLEVTFTIPISGITKIDTLPPHLRAMAMRLILEPAKFISQELCNYFWT